MTDIRVKKPKQYTDLMDKLHKERGKHGIFEQHTDTLTFAASLGFQRNKKIPIGTGESDEPIRLTIFNDDNIAFIDALALAETEDIHILAEEKTHDRVKIFEEYAFGGLEILYNELEGREELLPALIGLIVRGE